MITVQYAEANKGFGYSRLDVLLFEKFTRPNQFGVMPAKPKSYFIGMLFTTPYRSGRTEDLSGPLRTVLDI